MSHKRELSVSQRNGLLEILRNRFEQNPNRHKGMDWAMVAAKLVASPAKLWTLNEMEQSGGEPDVFGYDETAGEFIFFDCSAESPKGRRSYCYDHAALEARKENKPQNSAQAVANDMGASLLTEAQYAALQQLGEYDLKTSSWLQTPDNIRKLGGAIFGDRRYNQVFTYHNGAESYYAARGFRCVVRV